MWTDDGKSLLVKIQGNIYMNDNWPKHVDGDYIVNWMYHEENFGKWCFDYEEFMEKKTFTTTTKTLDPHYLSIVLQRGYDKMLVPLYDMINHHRGESKTNVVADNLHYLDPDWNYPAEDQQRRPVTQVILDGMRGFVTRIFRANNSTSSNDTTDSQDDDNNNSLSPISITATRNIKAGEELFYSYQEGYWNYNELASDIWGTPELLRDFGFVESYPHVYHIGFKFGGKMNFMIQEVVTKEEGGSDGHPHLELIWLSERHKNSNVNLTGIIEELGRLEELAKNDMTTAKGKVPDHELQVCRQYHQALTTALTLVIQTIQQEDEEEKNGKIPRLTHAKSHKSSA